MLQLAIGPGPAAGREEGRIVTRAIHVVASGPQDWIVREDGGRELGHYPSRSAAVDVGRMLARKRKAELLVQDPSGKTERSRPRRGWLAKLLGR